ncbi:uncharacterized protein LOC119188969 [Manduca sexta]|uniref:uncharacterized protein LOC119188969 n=1 Tax=Manduca sexta TaxID=7130 RepID=UPI00188F2DB5|nr:uncharacterized protein LOC119188969 [Manduca sexta]
MWRLFLTIASMLVLVAGHGRVIQPTSRASAWRAGFPTKPDYDDDGVNCGGMWHQWSYNKGKCGICGDRYDAKPPRAHELGGTYGEGIIVAHYLPSSVFTVTVHLTTSHKGFWEFKLCPDPHRNDQECFDEYPLELEEGGTKYYPTRGSVKYDVNYRLPSGLVCDHCVLQWRYTAGNNWGICPNGTGGLGCGNQEQFGACSDVSIGAGKSGLKYKPEGYDDMPSVLLHYLSKGYYDLQGKNDRDIVNNELDYL